MSMGVFGAVLSAPVSAGGGGVLSSPLGSGFTSPSLKISACPTCRYPLRSFACSRWRTVAQGHARLGVDQVACPPPADLVQPTAGLRVGPLLGRSIGVGEPVQLEGPPGHGLGSQ